MLRSTSSLIRCVGADGFIGRVLRVCRCPHPISGKLAGFGIPRLAGGGGPVPQLSSREPGDSCNAIRWHSERGSVPRGSTMPNSPDCRMWPPRNRTHLRRQAVNPNESGSTQICEKGGYGRRQTSGRRCARPPWTRSQCAFGLGAAAIEFNSEIPPPKPRKPMQPRAEARAEGLAEQRRRV